MNDEKLPNPAVSRPPPDRAQPDEPGKGVGALIELIRGFEDDSLTDDVEMLERLIEGGTLD